MVVYIKITSSKVTGFRNSSCYWSCAILVGVSGSHPVEAVALSLGVEVARSFWCCLWRISLSKRSEPITHFGFHTWCPYRMVAYTLEYISWSYCFESQFISSSYTTVLTHFYGAVFYVITICFIVVYVLLYFIVNAEFLCSLYIYCTQSEMTIKIINQSSSNLNDNWLYECPRNKLKLNMNEIPFVTICVSL